MHTVVPVPRLMCPQQCSVFSFSLQLEYVDSRAVQLGSLFVRGLTTLVLVNSACGFPWNMSDFMPWNVFDGKLFHQKYLLSEKGHSVEALVEQNVSPLSFIPDTDPRSEFHDSHILEMQIGW